MSEPRDQPAKIFELSAERTRKLAKQNQRSEDFIAAHGDIIEKLNQYAEDQGGGVEGAQSAANLALTSMAHYLVFYMSGGGSFPINESAMLREFYVERTGFAISEWQDKLKIQTPE